MVKFFKNVAILSVVVSAQNQMQTITLDEQVGSFLPPDTELSAGFSPGKVYRANKFFPPLRQIDSVSTNVPQYWKPSVNAPAKLPTGYQRSGSTVSKPEPTYKSIVDNMSPPLGRMGVFSGLGRGVDMPNGQIVNQPIENNFQLVKETTWNRNSPEVPTRIKYFQRQAKPFYVARNPRPTELPFPGFRRENSSFRPGQRTLQKSDMA